MPTPADISDLRQLYRAALDIYRDGPRVLALEAGALCKAARDAAEGQGHIGIAELTKWLQELRRASTAIQAVHGVLGEAVAPPVRRPSQYYLETLK